MVGCRWGCEVGSCGGFWCAGCAVNHSIAYTVVVEVLYRLGGIRQYLDVSSADIECHFSFFFFHLLAVFIVRLPRSYRGVLSLIIT